MNWPPRRRKEKEEEKKLTLDLDPPLPLSLLFYQTLSSPIVGNLPLTLVTLVISPQPSPTNCKEYCKKRITARMDTLVNLDMSRASRPLPSNGEIFLF